MKFLFAICLLLLTASFAVAEPTVTRNREKGLFEFRDGDRVVFLGSAFIERLQNTGYLETMLTAAIPSKNITFRNLGWSGDTVWGDARALFGSRADGFKRLLSDVALCKPTVLIVCYGENEAYAGEAGLEEFRSGLSTLLDSLEATGARIVLLGPRQHEKMPPPLPDPAKYNPDLRKYNDVIGKVAKEKGHWYLDLFEFRRGNKKQVRTSTEDGMQLTAEAEAHFAQFLTQHLVGRQFLNAPTVDIDCGTHSLEARQAVVSEIEIRLEHLAFSRVDRHILFSHLFSDPTGEIPGLNFDAPPVVKNSVTAKRLEKMPGMPLSDLSDRFVVRGLSPGLYSLNVDGKLTDVFSNADLNAGIEISNGKAIIQYKRLAEAINEKNTLFFHRYRPQNETYLFLFRKHEQGNNAVEIPQFDPLIAELEKKIAVLKQPVKQKYELVKVK